MVLGRSTKKGARKGAGPKAGSSLSQHIHRVYSSTTTSGLSATKREILSQSGLQKQQDQEREAQKTRLDNMSSSERAELDSILHQESDQENYQSENIMSIDDILSGDASIDISHAGGELTALTDDLLGPSSQWVHLFIYYILHSYLLKIVAGSLGPVIIVHVEIEMSAATRHSQANSLGLQRHIWIGGHLWETKELEASIGHPKA